MSMESDIRDILVAVGKIETQMDIVADTVKVHDRKIDSISKTSIKNQVISYIVQGLIVAALIKVWVG